MKNDENTPIMGTFAYHETKRHSDTMFSFNIYPCAIPTDFTFVPLHWQDSMEIIYIKRGEGIVQVDFETYAAKAGDLFFILPGRMHGLRGIQKVCMEYENIIFDLNFIGSNNVDLCSQKYLQPILNGKIQFPTLIRKEDAFYQSIAASLDASDHLCAVRPQGYELGIKGHLLILFSTLIQLDATKEARPISYAHDKHMDKLKMVLSRIETDYDKQLTVTDMANECGYSTSHFMRWFKEATGTSFTSYLIEYRLDKAAQVLRNSDDTVLEIAERTGFDNLSNFNRLFKKRFEMTPSQFRQRNF